MFEITAFLRDSYRRLPRSNHVSMRSDKTAPNTGSLNVSSGERSAAAAAAASATAAAAAATTAAATEVSSSHPVTSSLTTGGSNAGRRWSMALSLMGHSQTSAQSLQSITGDIHSNGDIHIYDVSFCCSMIKHELDVVDYQEATCKRKIKIKKEKNNNQTILRN